MELACDHLVRRSMTDKCDNSSHPGFSVYPFDYKPLENESRSDGVLIVSYYRVRTWMIRPVLLSAVGRSATVDPHSTCALRRTLAIAVMVFQLRVVTGTP
jgi:hypothetical protein